MEEREAVMALGERRRGTRGSECSVLHHTSAGKQTSAPLSSAAATLKDDFASAKIDECSGLHFM